MLDRLTASTPPPRRVIDGSSRALLPDSTLRHDAGPQERIEVTVRLRPGAPIPDHAADGVDRAQFEREHASRPEDAARVGAFAGEHGIAVTETDLLAHRIVLSGTAASLEDAFGVKLGHYASPHDPDYRGREGVITIPTSLGDAVTGVFGLDDREQVKARIVPLAGRPERSLTPLDVAAAYHFPDADGAGQHIGIISLGGGYDDAVQAAYQKRMGVAHHPVTVRAVDGGADDPSDPAPTGENMLDAEIIGTIAPAAQTTMYIAPNSDRGFLDALSSAIHDPKAHNGQISISWGSPEENYTGQFLRAMNEELREAKAMGINVFAASGDNGSSDGVDDGRPHVDFPSASDGAIACGGTKLSIRDGGIGREVVWNELPFDGATGGGVSDRIPQPPAQAGSHVPPSPDGNHGRGVPDVAGDADPVTGYEILLPESGHRAVLQTLGGTSAVAPLYAGLSARLHQRAGSAADGLADKIYDAPAGAFHDVTQGNNGDYSARPGWDAASGRGSIDGEKLLAYLTSKVKGTAT